MIGKQDKVELPSTDENYYQTVFLFKNIVCRLTTFGKTSTFLIFYINPICIQQIKLNVVGISVNKARWITFELTNDLENENSPLQFLSFHKSKCSKF